MAYRTHTRSPGHGGGTVRELATGLGWFSIALGVTQLAAPRALSRAFGMAGSEGIVQAYGLRGIANGFGILAAEDPTPWIWGRVAGDALDMSTLAIGLSDNNWKRDNVVLAMAAVAGVAALDIYCARALGSADQRPDRIYHYGDRSGFRRPAAAMRGEAAGFEIPRDFRTPEALRPYTTV